MDQRTRRSPARFLGPLALIAVLIAFLAIVSGSGGGGGSSSNGSATTPATTSSSGKKSSSKSGTATKSKSKSAAGGRRTYTVQVGDTLGSIASKTGVPLTRIETLNPDVDPHAMVAGQKIKLK